MMHLILLSIFSVYVDDCFGRGYHGNRDGVGVGNKLKTEYSWKQISYVINKVHYTRDADSQNRVQSQDPSLNQSERFFIQYNNVPIGFEVYKHKVFVTVPRRRYGIPSTLNRIAHHSSALTPYPPNWCPGLLICPKLFSVYRPRIDACGRLWAVDTGLLEVPGERKQVQKPALLVFNPETGENLLYYYLKDTDLKNERTTGGLTSVTIDVDPRNCSDAYAYITDLATDGLVVFSLAQMDSWRLEHSSFMHEESALNFTVAGIPISWRDGLFSIALSDPDSEGKRTVYYHALVSTKEYAVDTTVLKSRGTLEGKVKVLGDRGPLTQSGSHAYHGRTKTLLFANVAQDAILCWRVDTPLTLDNVAMVVQDHEKLVYISDLKVVGDDVWVLVNQIPRFVYSTLDINETNYYIHRGRVEDLIKGTVCDPMSKIHFVHLEKKRCV